MDSTPVSTNGGNIKDASTPAVDSPDSAVSDITSPAPAPVNALPAEEVPVRKIDPFLAEMLPADRSARKRVIDALLRSVLAAGKSL